MMVVGRRKMSCALTTSWVGNAVKMWMLRIRRSGVITIGGRTGRYLNRKRLQIHCHLPLTFFLLVPRHHPLPLRICRPPYYPLLGVNGIHRHSTAGARLLYQLPFLFLLVVLIRHHPPLLIPPLPPVVRFTTLDLPPVLLPCQPSPGLSLFAEPNSP